MKIITLPAFNDNYIWLFHAENSNQAYVVDPGDAAVVEQALQQHNLVLAGILVTHHHFDHTGGIEALCEDRNIPVYGGQASEVTCLTHKFEEGQKLHLDQDLEFQIIDVPGHTMDHIAFYSAESKTLFCGDTLFVAGCGRLFEGSAAQMRHSLEKLAKLPTDTKIYCAHEYTQANLQFALAVEPDNLAIRKKIEHVNELREQDCPSVPSTLADELATNPFLRSDQPAVVEQSYNREGNSNLNIDQVFASIRGWKDSF
ncbi:MAG: hydroxyacylglutathione hydrolase [Candidatus Pelagadaptatus aseana]|uniref:hydroxyacylglutathione hydrolase n=1 Tax=Candidatus Pelagadaptatus aseana TaxID=3120508 RepID=UPI0039B276E0